MNGSTTQSPERVEVLPGAERAARSRMLLLAANPATWAVLIAVIFFAANLAVIDRYGMSWDEPAVMERGRQTIRLLGSLVSRDDSERPTLSYLHTHPSFYATCDYVVAQFLVEHLHWKRLPAGHFLNLFTASAGLIIVFLVGRSLFNARVGLLAVMFMVLFPRFTAHAHYNSKDVPVMVFGSLALLLLYRAARLGRPRDWLLAALAFAWGVTTKLDGLFVLPIFILPLLLARCGRNVRAWGSEFQKLNLFLYTSLFLVFLFWPELWINPLHLLRSVSTFSGRFMNSELTYLGHRYAFHQIPWHYLPVHLAVVTPVLALPVLASGMIVSLRRLRKGENFFEHALLLSWLLIPVTARMIPGTMQYDGMRHVFLVLPAMGLLAGLGIDRLFARWKNCLRKTVLGIAALSGVAGWIVCEIVRCHPHEGYYLNEAARCLVPRQRLGEYFDFYGWGATYKDGIDWLNANAPQGASIGCPHDYLLGRYELRPDLRLLARSEAYDADFFMIGNWSRADVAAFDSPPVFAVRCYDSDLLRIYRHQQ